MNSKYKNLSKIALILLISVGMARCNEGENALKPGGEILFPDALPGGIYDVAVSDIEITAGLRTLNVKWEAPDNTSQLSYYQVQWQGTSIDTTIHSEPVKETSYQIKGLYNDSYTVSVVAVSKSMQKSEPVKAEGVFEPMKDVAGPDQVDNLQSTPVATSATLVWVNPEDEDFSCTIVKVRKSDETEWFLTDTLPTIENSISVVGLSERSEYSYSIQTFDYIGNGSEILVGTFKTKMEAMLQKLDGAGKPLWEIVDFSSQETRGDNGYAANALDGNNKTFWHSVWNGGDFHDGISSGAVPQYLVVDLKQEVIPTVVILYRRDGNSAGPTSVRIETTLKDPTTKDPEWKDMGIYALDGKTNNGGLACNLRETALARYVKITVMAVGNGNYAMLREIEMKGLVDEE